MDKTADKTIDKTTVYFDLDQRQSEQLKRTGGCVVLEPMDPQPPDGYYYNGITGISGRLEAVFARLPNLDHTKIIPLPYHIGQQVSIRQEWTTDGKVYKKEPGIITAYIEPASTMPEHLHLQSTIQNIDVKRADEMVLVKEVFGYTNYERGKEKFKDYFNKQFAQPRPVECRYDNCLDTSYKPIVIPNYDYDNKVPDSGGVCSNCNGDGIESYLAYLYDKKSCFMQWPYEFIEKPTTFEDKLLQITTNPYLYILTLETG